MSTYIIGDVQGCFLELQALLQKIDFNPQKDQLGFVGDLVNRGQQSLDVLRFIRNLPSSFVVLGNHDLYLLIIGYGLMPKNTYAHTLDNILEASDKIELLEWLRHQPFIYHQPSSNFLMVHAGIPPQWSVHESLEHAHEINAVLRGTYFKTYLRNLFGNEPNCWDKNLSGQNRWRYITNALTRMRYCDCNGKLSLDLKHPIKQEKYKPWFQWREARKDKIDIVFGHWAALNGQCNTKHCYALDTGCAWGHELTVLRLEDKKIFSVPAFSGAKWK